MHVPRSTIHVTRGRSTTIQTQPIPDVTPAMLDAVDFVLDGRPAIAASYETSGGGLVVTIVLPAEATAPLELGRHFWQLLPTSNTSVALDPLAEGVAIVTDPALVGP